MTLFATLAFLFLLAHSVYINYKNRGYQPAENEDEIELNGNSIDWLNHIQFGITLFVFFIAFYIQRDKPYYEDLKTILMITSIAMVLYFLIDILTQVLIRRDRIIFSDDKLAIFDDHKREMLVDSISSISTNNKGNTMIIKGEKKRFEINMDRLPEGDLKRLFKHVFKNRAEGRIALSDDLKGYL